jgi:hypothetical protein
MGVVAQLGTSRQSACIGARPMDTEPGDRMGTICIEAIWSQPTITEVCVQSCCCILCQWYDRS